MTSIKAKSGGARPKRRSDDGRTNNGGRPGVGRMVRWIELSAEDARSCRILGYRIKEEIERFVSSMIRERWKAYDENIQAIVDEFEGIV